MGWLLEAGNVGSQPECVDICKIDINRYPLSLGTLVWMAMGEFLIMVIQSLFHEEIS